MSRPVRVLRLIARLNVGGPARHVVWLAHGLADKGFETSLVTGVVGANEQDMSDFATSYGVTPLVVPTMGREISLRDLVTLWRVWRLMVRFRPDIVHTHTAKAGTIGRVAGLLYRFATPGAWIGRPRRVRFIHTYHGHVLHGYYGPWKSRLFAAIERALARVNTERLVVLSPQQLEEIHVRFRIGRREQFTIVPLGLDLAALSAPADRGAAVRQELGIGGGESVIGIVGRITAIKNHDLFLDVAQLRAARARFVVYGDGEDRPRLEMRGAPVLFAGTRPAADIYASLDIVAVTSRNEGTPLVIIEAMAAGKPVISTRVGGVADLLGPVVETVDAGDDVRYDVHERGITVASDDARSFAAGLDRLLDDEGLRARLVRAANAYVRSTHTREAMIGSIMTLYAGPHGS